MPTREPNVKEKTKTTGVSYELSDFLKELRAKCHFDDDDRATWKNKMIVATNQRLGIKRYSNFPYPGAPDIPLPETDKIIKKMIPTLVLSSWNQKKLATVKVAYGVQETPEYKEKAKKAEMALNGVLRSQDMDWFRKLMLAADNTKHFGHCIFKTFEKFSSRKVHKVIDLEDYSSQTPVLKKMRNAELSVFLADRYDLDLEDKDDKKTIKDIIKQFRSGEDIIEFDLIEVKSYPCVEVINPIKITVPAYTQDINQANRIHFEYFLTRDQLERMMEDEVFITHDMDEIANWQGEEDIVETQKQRNEGITDNTSSTDLYRIEEICCYYKGKRKVYTFFRDIASPDESLLQDIDFPYEWDGWFYDKHDNEIKDKRYFSSRGIPEQIRAMQEIMERSINNMIIRDEMLNTPLWEVLDTSEIMDTHIRLTPGAKLPVKQLGQEIKQLNEFPKGDTASQQIITLLKAYTEEYLASNDQLFRNASNSGGGKTLGEVNLGIQQNAGPMQIEVTNWDETLSKVYKKIFDIMAERLGDSIYIDNTEITREDFNFPAEVRSNGDLEVSNEQLSVQKSMARLQVLLNPALQDIVNSEDRFNALRDWLEKDGIKDPDLFCTDPKKIAQERIVQMQQQMNQLAQQTQMQGKMMEDQVGKTHGARLDEQIETAKAKEALKIRKQMEEENQKQVETDIFAGAMDGLFGAGQQQPGGRGAQEALPSGNDMQGSR